MKLTDIIRKAIELGEANGTLTFDQLNELIPSSIAPEDIEAVLSAVSDHAYRSSNHEDAPAHKRPAFDLFQINILRVLRCSVERLNVRQRAAET